MCGSVEQVVDAAGIDRKHEALAIPGDAETERPRDEVERRTGRLRASISVRYTKESEPKDLPPAR